MDFIGGALPNVMLITGLIAIGIGLGIQFKIVEINGELSRTSRIGAILVGIFLIGGSLYFYTRPAHVATTGTTAPQAVQAQPVAATAPTPDATAPAAVVNPTAVPTSSAPAATAVPLVTVPDLRGKSAKEAEKILAETGLLLGDAQTDCDALGATPSESRLKKDAILCQSPAPDTSVAVQSEIVYVLADKQGR
ncbi:MAG TPA: PASTA domain-containing protein [Roseiflexaceae bacterium]|nr:PASTA domain-containing protein [Roseiflexaceae bacterium]